MNKLTIKAQIKFAHTKRLVELELFEKIPFLIGREVKDLKLSFEKVSRQHAALIFSDGRVTIKDEKSINGTYVNDINIDQILLQEGDLVKIGPFSIKIIEFHFSESLQVNEVDKTQATELYEKDFINPIELLGPRQIFKYFKAFFFRPLSLWDKKIPYLPKKNLAFYSLFLAMIFITFSLVIQPKLTSSILESFIFTELVFIAVSILVLRSEKGFDYLGLLTMLFFSSVIFMPVFLVLMFIFPEIIFPIYIFYKSLGIVWYTRSNFLTPEKGIRAFLMASLLSLFLLSPIKSKKNHFKNSTKIKDTFIRKELEHFNAK